MDPITAFGVAVNILTVVQISAEIVSTTREVYQKGRSIEHGSLKSVAEDLQTQNVKLKAAVARRSATQEDSNLIKLADQSNEVATELLQILAKLEPVDKKDIVKSLKIGIRSWWSQDRIKSTAEQLQTLRDEVDHHILGIVKEQGDHISQQQKTHFDKLDARQRDLLQTVLDSARANHDASETQSRKLDEVLKLLNQFVVSDAVPVSSVQGLPGDSYRTDAAAVLNWLRFSSMTDRRETISEAHRKTFEWIFSRYDDTEQDLIGDQKEDNGTENMAIVENNSSVHNVDTSSFHRDYETSSTPSLGTDSAQMVKDSKDCIVNIHEGKSVKTGFPEWLEQANGVFWIHGKAGCGKSTLMKFITDDKRISEALKSWAAEKPLIVCSFYFWSSGTELQRSLKGLYRGLLYDLVSQRTELAGIAFPGFRWLPNIEPQLSELQAGLKRILRPTQHDFRLCIFLDGLDEYEGDGVKHASLAESFLDAAHSEDVKIVISSRPLPVLQDILGICPSLAVHSLTRQDIETYIKDKLAQNSKMLDLSRSNPQQASQLVEDISYQASGVFLWVTIVVNTLLDGLRNHEGFSELRNRLHELPSELEDLYKHMFSKISPHYKAKAVKLFQLVQAAYGCLPSSHISALRLSYTLENDPDFAFRFPIGPLSASEILERRNSISELVKSRCVGLLEVDVGDSPVESPKETSANFHHEAWSKYHGIKFIHRTASEFLSGEVSRASHDATKDFYNALLRLVQSFIIEAKTIPHAALCIAHEWRMERISNLDSIRIRLARAASIYEFDASKPCLRELDEMDRVTKLLHQNDEMADGSMAYVKCSERANADTDESRRGTHDDMLMYTLSTGADLYSSYKIRSVKDIVASHKGLLHSCLSFLTIYSSSEIEAQIQRKLDNVHALLEHGFSPNELIDGSSAWQVALHTINERAVTRHKDPYGFVEISNLLILILLLVLFLEFGANPNSAICLKNGHLLPSDQQDADIELLSATTIIDRLGTALASWPPPDAEESTQELEMCIKLERKVQEHYRIFLQKFEEKKARIESGTSKNSYNATIPNKASRDSTWRGKAVRKLKGWKNQKAAQTD